jgi:hypothetical protein
MIVLTFGALSLLLGTVIAYAAEWRPRRRAAMELWGGLLIVGGIAVLSIQLGHTIGRH